MKRGKQADSQRRNQTGGVRGQGRWRTSLSSASVELMTTESGDDCMTSATELTPLTRASKRGDVLICKLYLNNLVYFLKKIRRIPLLCPSKCIQSCPPSGRKLTSQHGGRMVFHELPLHRRRVCRTCSPETTSCPGHFSQRTSGNGWGAGARWGILPPHVPLPLDLCMTSAGRMTQDIACQRSRSSVALLVLFA